ncbi:TrbI/VirB10 family protein [Caulobacter sp. UNC279MFTsu5.1]|uniref:TrbI/VirB10 family protein n=1 Tax=Caulobacter sp. UNC279MFTsu5.1 TaxID=1502775 RepID=UPI0008F03077|nr:TrbI/VirB10 family protein [Caulobacter sp. UNC279MFTsu5.1]SFI59849.1 type IV secretion system protein VirB10 [Caulobacter sp. UNC279MFTsu5.1]
MTQAVDQEQQAIAKTLRLRGPAKPVAQVSRKALMVTGGLLAIGLSGALVWSLRERDKPAPPPVLQAAAPPEAVTGLPRDYLQRRQAPVLGPPLPGDLGRPMLSAQRTRGLERSALSPSVTPALEPTPALPRPARRPALVDPVVQAADGARASGLFAAAAVRRAEPVLPAPTAGSAAPDERATSPERLQAPASPYLLQAGSIIPAALVTGLRSDAAGLAIAQVSQDVYDSLGRHLLLIPAGAKLIGQYEATTHVGQSRLSVAWTRLILPTGRSIILDKLPAADAQGMAGLADGVDRHGKAVLAAAALSTVLAIGAEAGQSSGGDDLERAIRRGAGQSISDVGQQAVGRSLALTPTLTIRPGAPLRVLLTRDLVLEPYDRESGQ